MFTKSVDIFKYTHPTHPHTLFLLSSHNCQNLFSCGWHLFEEISFCMWHSVKGTNSTITALYWLFSVYERVKKWNLPKYDCLVLIIKDLKKDYDSHIAIYLWSKISFLRINVKLKVILEIVNKFVKILSSYNCRNLFSLNRHLYEEISSNNCHSTNWGDTKQFCLQKVLDK